MDDEDINSVLVAFSFLSTEHHSIRLTLISFDYTNVFINHNSNCFKGYNITNHKDQDNVSVVARDEC
jgi:hypothetical protein